MSGSRTIGRASVSTDSWRSETQPATEPPRDLCPVVVIGGPTLVEHALLHANGAILDRGDGQKARCHPQAAEQHGPPSPDRGLTDIHRVTGDPVRPADEQIIGGGADLPSLWSGSVVAGHRPQQQCRAGAQRKRTDKVYRPRSTGRPPVAPTPLGERDRGTHEERRKHHALGHEVHSARDPSTHETQRIAERPQLTA